WVLLTSLPCETLAQCMKVVKLYAARWLVEEYHKALKTGTGVEESQLETAAALEALIAVLALVAVRLLGLKLVARTEPQKAVEVGALGPEVWAILAAKYGRPPGGWTARTTLVAIARLGGFLARKGDGDPGWLTIWRGWQRLMHLAEGYLLAGQRSARCG
ncbi:MAG: IS4 family transposase, partial [Planctomycetota bacterium]